MPVSAPVDFVDAVPNRAPAPRSSLRGFALAPAVANLVILVGFVCILGVAQIQSGAYLTERVNYSDEAAHFMNGLVLRDYLVSGFHQDPLTFARDYYLHYPKIAPLAWPPLFHIALAVSMLPGWSPHAAALVVVLLTVAWTAWRLYGFARLISGRPAAVFVSGLFVLSPMMIDVSSAVMADGLLAACAIEAAYWLSRFYTSASRRHAALFGLFAALACLTKGNGLGIVLTPALLLGITWRFSLLRHSGLYIAAAIVLALAAPFVAYSYRFDAGIGDFQPVTMHVIWTRAKFYTGVMHNQWGGLVLAIVGAGAAAVVLRRPKVLSEDAFAASASLLTLAVGTVIFHLVNPHEGVAARYMSTAVAPLLALIPVAIGAVVEAFPSPRRRQLLSAGLMTIVAALFLLARPSAEARQPAGWRDVVKFLADGNQIAGHRIAVISDENGEGALVSEIAGRHPEPMASVVRGTKLLASDDWNGRNFKMTFASPAAVMKELEDLHVDALVVDGSRPAQSLAFWGQVNALLAQHGSRLAQAYWVQNARGPIVVYRLLYKSPGAAKPLRVAASTGEVLTER